MYEALYSQDIGLCGFRCRVGECTRVVRTQRGILMHCKRVHGLVAQRELFDTGVKEKKDGKSKAKTAEKLEPVRSAGGGTEHFVAVEARSLFERERD